ncbi:unnamed protein product [Mycena citricolor]|uniref:Uncharacterized protein n=1 Tax=Mycena citricolor TaxID=2018698 RepID=A0AAD2GTU4_9AGAR|nr:unnamed protein product [Mycena citricolor]
MPEILFLRQDNTGDFGTGGAGVDLDAETVQAPGDRVSGSFEVVSSTMMLSPELTATQSSWLMTVHWEIVTPDALTSNPSVLWPRAAPAAASIDVLDDACSGGSHGDGLGGRVEDGHGGESP